MFRKKKILKLTFNLDFIEKPKTIFFMLIHQKGQKIFYMEFNYDYETHKDIKNLERIGLLKNNTYSYIFNIFLLKVQFLLLLKKLINSI